MASEVAGCSSHADNDGDAGAALLDVEDLLSREEAVVAGVLGRSVA